MIQLRLTLGQWPSTAPDHAQPGLDLRVSAPTGASARQLFESLHRFGAPTTSDVCDGSRGWFVDGRRVAAHSAVGQPPLLDGAVLTRCATDRTAHTVRAGRTARVAHPSPAAHDLELHVVTGPDAGAVHALTPGLWSVGRDAGAAIRIDDPDVSRWHLELRVAAGTVDVRDAGSTNGTTSASMPPGSTPPGSTPLGAMRLRTTFTAWGLDESLHLGSSVVTLRRVQADVPAALTADGGGHLLVNRGPRITGPRAPVQLDYPTPPVPPEPTRLPWPTILLPLLLAVPVAVLWHQPTFLLIGLLSPLLAGSQYVMDRRSRSGRAARELAAHRERCAELDDALAVHLVEHAARRHEDHPDLAAVASTARRRDRRLWERGCADDDVLDLRLGLGRVSADVVVRREHETRHAELVDVPVTADLAGARVVGVCGPPAAVHALARSLVGQAAVWHSPRDLSVVVLAAQAGQGAQWTWTNLLPHALPDARTHVRPRGRPDGHPQRQRTLVVLDGAHSLRRRPDVAALLDPAGDPLTVVMCLEEARQRLPAECVAVVELCDDGTGLRGTWQRDGRPPQPFAPDLAGSQWAQCLARSLAPLRDATPADPDDVLPQRVDLVPLLTSTDGVDVLDPTQVAARWSLPEPSATGVAACAPVVVGVTADGPWTVDLEVDGPHVLVAGTTGAGKSELLTTLVASLAARCPPDRLTFLLVDYKGGTAFGRLADLPHVTGVLTDLDARTARRALASLVTELRRRERWMREHRTGERSAGPALTRLVIVVDEFRVLAEEQPELLDGLVRVATVGRSLGVHLVLATQRPGGVVSADIRANVNLRIGLRLRDRADSQDVLDDPHAAALPPNAPGRALARSGDGRLMAFQAAYLSPGGEGVHTKSPEAAHPVRVEPLEPDPLVPSTTRVPASAHPLSHDRTQSPHDGDLDRLVAALRAAAQTLAVPEPSPPWVPPLPAVVTTDELLTACADGIGGAGAGIGGADHQKEGSRWRLAFAVADLPAEQRRAPLSWDLRADGHAAVVGGPASGRTTTLLALAHAALRAGVEVHAVDAGSGLVGPQGLGGLDAERTKPAGLGTLTPAQDLDRAQRLVARLAESLHPLENDLRVGPDGLDGRSDGRRPVLLLVDGWEALEEAWSRADHGRAVDELLRLARDGAGAGVRLAVSGGRALLSGTWGSLLSERFLLPVADPAVHLLAGVPADAMPGRQPPGRVLRVRGGHDVVEAHVALPDPRGVRRPSLDHSPALGATHPAPVRIAALPRRLPVTAQAADSAATGGLGYVGVGDDDALPVGLPLHGVEAALVCGGPGSGRSTALATIAWSLVRVGRRVIVVTDGRSPAARLDVDRHTPQACGSLTVLDHTASRGAVWSGAVWSGAVWSGAEPGTELVAELVDALRTPTAEGCVLVLDDGWAAVPGLEEVATAHLRRPPDGAPDGRPDHRLDGSGRRLRLVVGATTADASTAFRGLVASVRTSRTGLLLGPRGPADGDVLGVALPARPEGAAGPGGPSGLAGRGMLVVRGDAVRVQVAQPPFAPGRPDTNPAQHASPTPESKL